MTLWLDDIREPWKHGFVDAAWVKTADEAIEALKTGQYQFASLDHDLTVPQTMGIDDKERTGYDVILWLEANPEYWPEGGVRVHSMNPSGGHKMRLAIHAHYGRLFL